MKKIQIYLYNNEDEENTITLASSLASIYDIEIVSLYPLKAIYNEKKLKVNNLVTMSSPILEQLKKKKYENLTFKDIMKKIFLKYLKKGHIVLFVKDLLKLGIDTHIKSNYLFRKSIKSSKAQIIISTDMRINKMISKLAGKNITKIAWEQNHHHNNFHYLNKYLKSIKGMHKLIVPNMSLQASLSNILLTRGIKCKVIYIHNALSHIEDITSKLNNKTIVSIGKLTEKEDFSSLIEVMMEVVKKDNKIKLKIVGNGIKYQELEALIKEYKLNNNVQLLGYLEKDELIQTLINSSLYVMSSYIDFSGRVLLEAMSVGLPCLAFSDALSAQELIKNDINGYVIENRDKILMASKIVELLNDKATLKSLGTCSKEMSSNYDINSIKSEWIKNL